MTKKTNSTHSITPVKRRGWIPEIVYADESCAIPSIYIPKEEMDPRILFITLSRLTGNFEPDDRGRESEICEMTVTSFANMSTLKENLTGDEYDRVRLALGLKPVAVAIEEGRETNEKVRENLKHIAEERKLEVSDS